MRKHHRMLPRKFREIIDADTYRDDALGGWCRGWRLFPLARVVARAPPAGARAKGILRRTLTAGNGLPLANRATPAKGDERVHVVPLLEAVKVRTGKRGRPANV